MSAVAPVLLIMAVLLPLLVAAVRPAPRVGGMLVTAAAVAGAGVLVAVAAGGPATVTATRLDAGGVAATLGLRADALAAILLVLVTGVGAVVTRFALRYLDGDPRHRRFSAGLGLTIGASAGLVTAASLPLLAVCWLAVGAGLQVLLTHAAPEVAIARSGARRTRRAFLLGDLALLAGVVAAAAVFGDTDLTAIAAAAPGVASLSPGAVELVAALLALGAMTRSAQLPFSRWMPETLAAPTPVSALLHAGLVNVAGFLVARLAGLYVAAPVTLTVLLVVGVLTAIWGTALMLVRSDVKGALAFSTVGQMGFMLAQAGLGAFAAAVFHLVGHGLFKATLFLSSGSAVHQARQARTAPTTTRPASRARQAAAALGVAVPPALVLGLAVAGTGEAVSLLLTILAAVTAAELVAGLLRRGVGPIGGVVLGLCLGGLLAGYLAGVRAFEQALGLPAVPGVGPAVAIAVAIALVAATTVVLLARRDRWPWLWAWAATRATAVPSAGPALDRREARPLPVGAVSDAERGRIRAVVARAADVLPPLYPLTAFVATNPLRTNLPFDEACAQARDRFGARTHLSLAQYRQLHAEGRITTADIDAALLAANPLAGHGPFTVAGCRITSSQLARLSLLHGLLDTPAAEPVTVGDTPVDAIMALWCAAHLDRGQAAWPMPGRDDDFYVSWRALAGHRAAPPLPGISGAAAVIRALPDRPEDALVRALRALGVPPQQWADRLATALATQPGWAAAMTRRAAADRPDHPGALVSLLAVRLCLETLLGPTPPFAPAGTPAPEPADLLARTAAALGLHPSEIAALPADGTQALLDALTSFDRHQQAAVWLRAYEAGYRRALLRSMDTRAAALAPAGARPDAQIVCCIDARSEGLRRHLETESAGAVATLGFAGFFGLPVHHVPLGAAQGTDQCPVLLTPGHQTGEKATPAATRRLRGLRTLRRLDGAVHAAEGGRGNVLAPLVFVEIAGWPLGAAALLRTAAPRLWGRARSAARAAFAPAAPVDLAADTLTPDEQVAWVEAGLRMMGLTRGFGRLVVLCGHGSTTENNPYESAFDCGACGGNRGAVNARLFATLLNTESVRTGLAERGIHVPADTVAVAAEHDTATDVVTLMDTERLAATHTADLARMRRRLGAAGAALAAERCGILPGAPIDPRPDRAAAHVAARSADWAQVRPEWGLAGNAGFVVGPRALTAGADLSRRAFLHSYDPETDVDGAALEVILTAPLVVAQWINSQYYFSTVDNDRFGAGSKVLHNVVGGAGVISGHRGDLRLGLPWQSVSDGSRLVHEPVRLLAAVYAPRARISMLIARNSVLQEMFDHEWVHLVALDPGDGACWRYAGAGRWEPEAPAPVAEPAATVVAMGG